jgi:hypothetical protein
MMLQGASQHAVMNALTSPLLHHRVSQITRYVGNHTLQFSKPFLLFQYQATITYNNKQKLLT